MNQSDTWPAGPEAGRWPTASGHMAERIRKHDWASTPVGHILSWPQSLRTAVDLILGSPMAMLALWGPKLVQIYNDGYCGIMAARHPAGLGQMTEQCWPDAWPLNSPIYEAVLRGERCSCADQKLTIKRGGLPEESWFDLTYSPLRDEAGDVAGILVTAVETSVKVLTERRQHFHAELEHRLRPLLDPNDVLALTSEELGRRLGAEQVAYGKIDESGDFAIVEHDWQDGSMPSCVGRHKLDDFGPAFAADLRRGETIVIADVGGDPRTSCPEWLSNFDKASIKALLSIPLKKNGHLVALLCVHGKAPRAWRPAEVALAEEAAEMTWAALARAGAELGLRESEARFQQIADNVDAAFYVTELPERQVLYISPAYERLWGLDRKELLKDQSSWVRLLHPDDREEVTAKFNAFIAGGPPFEAEYRVVLPDGQLRWIRDRATAAMRDGSGAVTRAAGLAQDVTAAKRFEARVRESDLRMRALVEGIPQLVWSAFNAGLWTWSSPQWNAFTGLTAEASEGLGWLDAVHPDDHEAVMAVWREAEENARFEAEYRVFSKTQNAYRWMQARGAPMRDDTGKIIEWLGTCTDIDELRRMQDQQSVMVAELQHRTRNLLAVVQSIAHQTMKSSDTPEEFKQHFGDRLTALSRVQGLLSRSDREPITLNALITMEFEAVCGQAFQHQITVAGPEVALRKTTVQTLALAIHELATNARKHGALSSGEGSLSVSWGLRQCGDGERRLTLDWVERRADAARPETPPAKKGYGQQLITQALPYSLGAETRLEFGKEGVRCSIDLPLSMRDDKEVVG